MEFLKARHYQVFRTAGSHGVADVIAFDNTWNESLDIDTTMSPLWVQCKKGKKEKWNFSELVEKARACGATPISAYKAFRKKTIYTDLLRERTLFDERM